MADSSDYAVTLKDEKSDIQLIVQAPMEMLDPTNSRTVMKIRDKYRETLSRAATGSVNPSQWYIEWLTVYLQAKALGVSDVEGALAAQDFLRAVSQKMAPEWGRRELINLIGDDALGRQPKGIEDLGKWFSVLVDNDIIKPSTAPGIFRGASYQPAFD